MRFLLESEAKSILAAAGIEIPAHWPDAFVPEDETGPFFVKVLVPEGGRGKRGGVARVEDRSSLEATIRSLLATWNGATPQGVQCSGIANMALATQHAERKNIAIWLERFARRIGAAVTVDR